MNVILEMLRGVGFGLVVLLPLVNPLTTVVLMLGLSKNMDKQERDQQSLMTSIYVFLIMAVAFYGGQLVIRTFGISIPGLRIAGGMIVVIIGIEMLFPKPQIETDGTVKAKAEEIRREHAPNIAFIPLAMPGSAGPGTIAMLISMAATLKSEHASPLVFYVGPVLTFLVISIVMYFCLMSSSAIMKLFGKSGIEAIARLMGFLMVCIGVQFVINGILEIVTNVSSATS